MRRSEPVLTDPDDLKVWNKIDDIDQEGKRWRRQQDKLTILAVIDNALTPAKHLHSAVLVKMLRKAAHEKVSNLESVAIKILDVCRPGDMFPIMEAADIVIRDGSLEVSRSLMDRLTDVPDTAFMEYLKGMFASRSGDEKGAVNHLIRSNAIDQSFIRTYDVLISMDPGKGWDVLRNIPLIMAGEKPKQVHTDDKDMLDLQIIYDKWYGDERGVARKLLNSSAGYLSGHLDFLLAAARMNGDTGEYDVSLELYERVLTKYPNIDSVTIEKANILSAMGKQDEALLLIHTLGDESKNNRNVMECTLKALATANTEREFMPYAEKFLNSEHGDKDGHMLVCGLMSKIGMNNEASKILRSLILMFPDDVDVHLANAKNEIELERDSSALRSADRVIKLSPRSPDGYCIRADIHLRKGRMWNAVKDGEHALKYGHDHLGSLSVMKSIRIRMKEYDKALDLCRQMLIIEPGNADAMRDMAFALDMLGKRQDAMEEYKTALRSKKDVKMLISVISALIEGNRPREAAGMAKEFVDDTDGADLWCLRGNAEYCSSDYIGAAHSYSKALDRRPDDARLWHSKGLAEEKAGMYAEAESSYDRAVITDLDNPEFWLSKAIVQEKRGDLKGSVLSLNRVISHSPDNVFALVKKAKILSHTGRMKESLVFLDHALKVDGRNIKILDIKKDICKRNELYDGVISVCKVILNIDRKNAGAIVDMAEAYQKKGEHEESLKVLSEMSSDLGEIGVLRMKKNSAKLSGNIEVEIEACRSILVLEPSSRSAKLELADALVRNGRNEDAMEIYDSIQSNDPKDAEVIVLRGKLRSAMGDGQSAVALYHEAVLKDPENSGTLNELANALCDSGEYDEALNMIARAIEISPDLVSAYLTKSKILVSMNDTQNALTSLNDSLDVVLERGTVHMRIGEIHELRGELEDALGSYDSAVRSGIDDAYFRKGCIYDALGDREGARKNYITACRMDESNSRAWEKAGTMHLEDGEYDEARKCLDTALRKDPFDASALLSRARLYVKEGEKEKAIPIYRTLSGHDDCANGVKEELNMLLDVTEDVPEAMPFNIEDIPAKDDDPQEDDDSDNNDMDDLGEIYDIALLALERAYDTGSAISDSRMLSGLGIKGAKKKKMLSYLSDIKEYGDIDTGSKEFDRMERLSKNVILAECIEDIDSNPLVGIPAAYMASTAETIDDAKKLIAYIYRSINSDLEPVAFSNDISDAVAEVSEMSGDITVYGIMRMFNVGIFTARTIEKLSKKSGKDDNMHI
ncbi:MAG: tetratricopeptide repeat protein [Methanomassiliicoccaceae archaeon]|nr:tetratricopeptide repeat protein [Methanomassiliicoccaceae archaeon]